MTAPWGAMQSGSELAAGEFGQPRDRVSARRVICGKYDRRARTIGQEPDMNDYQQRRRAMSQDTAEAVSIERLMQTLDMTLAAWASALDLHDSEPVHHTERLADLAVQLAGTVGVADADLVQVRRGALLHD